MADRVFEELDEYQCLTLIDPTGVGRVAYVSRFGPAVLPVTYTVHRGAVIFRTAEHGPLDEDLRTGVAHLGCVICLQIDDITAAAGPGWSVLIQGPARLLTAAEEEDALRYTRVEPWAPGERELFIRIVPDRITGRRVSPA
jgi:nitroimidazol reductase NimA-like FMN-containing flavoprotein (pyridoxamine 5'-phosphate oxidase superfamily)